MTRILARQPGPFLAAAAWLVAVAAASPCRAADGDVPAPPAWLYPVNPAHADTPASDGKAMRHVPHSAVAYTNDQVDDLFIAPDWHPEEHPVPPTVVSAGRPPGTYACGYCHRIDGAGGPENAHLAGLPAAYIVQQLKDWRSGARASSAPARIPPTFMTAEAKSLTDDEIDAVARYFSAQAPVANFRVVETRVVPSVHVEVWRLAADDRPTRVPLGQRLLELPDRPQDFASRDSHVRFTVFAPLNSVARGRELVRGRAGATIPACAACHGARLDGSGTAPPLVGQSPSYLLRQLVDFQRGARNATQGQPMVSVARSLTMDDMIAVAAYAASLAPRHAKTP